MESTIHKSSVVGILVLLCLFSVISSQSNIPTVHDGFWYGQKAAAAEGTVLIEAFFDPVCPDSRDSWPPLKDALQKYGLRVSLVVHTFPLPATFNKSKAVVIDQIVDFTAKAFGPSYHSEIKSGFNDSKTDHDTRVAFKYGCLRGVYGTPYFFVNGFPLPDAGSALNSTEWRKVIDPLVSQQGTDWQHVKHFL